MCLERTLELDNARIDVRDWPGLDGPLVHAPDPLAATDAFVEALAHAMAPRFRVLSVRPRGGAPYQVDALDLLGVLDQFGFEVPILIGEGLGGLAALLVAAWYPAHVGGLVLVDPTCEPPSGCDNIPARALRESAPDWTRLQAGVRCPALVVRRDDPGTLAAVEAFAAATLP